MAPLVFKHIVSGKDIEVTAKEYNNKYLATHEQFERDFLEGFKEKIERYTKEPCKGNKWLYTIKYKEVEKEFCILWGQMRTSGKNARVSGREDKRLQIYASTPLKDGIPYFGIGAYFTKDTTIYAAVLKGIRESINLAQAGESKSYSSFWFYYSELWETYKSGKHSWIYSGDKLILATNAKHIGAIHDAIIKTLVGDNVEDTDIDDTKDKGAPQFVNIEDDINKYHDDHSLPRDIKFRQMAFERENYKCELCGTTKTFTDTNNEEYFEGHHLIMYNLNVQRRFKYSLDHPNNIMCLCPTCHRQIHLGSEEKRKEMIMKLFKKHNNLLKEYSIETLKPIIDDYKKI